VEVIGRHADGKIDLKLMQQLVNQNGGRPLPRIKRSTLFPEGWSNNDIVSSVLRVSNTPPIARRADGMTLHGSSVNGVQIDAIVSYGQVTSDFPSGALPTPIGPTTGFVVIP
jgi:hypothetical protein